MNSVSSLCVVTSRCSRSAILCKMLQPRRQDKQGIMIYRNLNESNCFGISSSVTDVLGSPAGIPVSAGGKSPLKVVRAGISVAEAVSKHVLTAGARPKLVAEEPGDLRRKYGLCRGSLTSSWKLHLTLRVVHGRHLIPCVKPPHFCFLKRLLIGCP